MQVHMVVCFAWNDPHSHSQMDCVISNFHDYLIRWWVVTWWPVKHKIAVCESMKRKIRDTINASEFTDPKWTLFPCQMCATQSHALWCVLHIVQWALQGMQCVPWAMARHTAFKWLNTDRQTQFCIYLHFGQCIAFCIHLLIFDSSRWHRSMLLGAAQ